MNWLNHLPDTPPPLYDDSPQARIEGYERGFEPAAAWWHRVPVQQETAE